MSLFIAPDSPEGKERSRWDRPRNTTVDGIPGMRCVGFEEYPKALYRAGRPNMGNVAITGSTTAHTQDQESILRGQGWHTTQEAAIQAVHAQHVEFSKLAAERHYVERSMSARAQAEAESYDAETVQHVPVIPEAPKKRGRPRRKPEVMS